jgi:hypothetical protein
VVIEGGMHANLRSEDDEHLIEQVLTAICEIARGAKRSGSFRYGKFGQQGRVDRTLSAGSFLRPECEFDDD